jgi:hypothetical protein
LNRILIYNTPLTGEVEPNWFERFEEATFFGKFSEIIVGLILREILKEKVVRQSHTESGFADFAIRGFGLVEVTTSRNKGAPDAEARRKWRKESRSADDWVVVPDELVSRYLDKVDGNFKYPVPGAELPPRDTQRQRIHVVSLRELFKHLEERLSISGLLARAMELTSPDELSRLAQPLLAEWESRFFGENAPS